MGGQWLAMGITMMIAGGVGGVAHKYLSDLGVLVVAGQLGHDPTASARDHLRRKAAEPNQLRSHHEARAALLHRQDSARGEAMTGTTGCHGDCVTCSHGACYGF